MSTRHAAQTASVRDPGSCMHNMSGALARLISPGACDNAAQVITSTKKPLKTPGTMARYIQKQLKEAIARAGIAQGNIEPPLHPS